MEIIIMGKPIEFNLNAKLCVPCEVFSLDIWHDGDLKFGAHRHSRAPSRVRTAHACSYLYLGHE